MHRVLRIAVLLCACTGLTRRAPAQINTAGPDKLYYPACQPFGRDLVFDCYRSFTEVTRFLQDAASQHPGLARLSSIGQSYQGRDLWLLTVTDFSTGPAEDKPAMWVDGGIDADEVIATEAALGLVHRLLTSPDTAVRSLLRRTAFYIAPMVIPDISEMHHTTPLRPRDTTLRPWDDDNDGQADEDGPDDLDGDRQALQMRRLDPTGDWVTDEQDGRLMRRRRAGDAGPFYRLYPEARDDDGDGRYGEDPVGGVDPNRNYPGNWSAGQRGGGWFPGSEAELRALMDFAAAHPNIAASQHFHSSGGVLLHPPSVPDWPLPETDASLYLDVSRRGLEVTGYALATSVYDWNWPAGSRNNRRGQVWREPGGEIRGWPESGGGGGGAGYPAYGGSIDAMYELFGVLAFANEIYRMGEDDDRDGQVSALEQLRYNDSVLGGAAFHPWTPFPHPQLGAVEIGGWRKFGQNNPIGARQQQEVQRNVDFALLQASLMPALVIAGVEPEALGNGIYRVTATVRNTGYQPTELAIRTSRDRAVPVRATLEAPSGVQMLSTPTRQDLGTLGGHADVEVHWLVRAAGGGTVTVRAWHPKAGRTALDVRLR